MQIISLFIVLVGALSSNSWADSMSRDACKSLDHFIDYASPQSSTKFTCETPGANQISLRDISKMMLSCRSGKQVAKKDSGSTQVEISMQSPCRETQVCHTPKDPKQAAEKDCFAYDYNGGIMPLLASDGYCFGGYDGASAKGALSPDEMSKGKEHDLTGVMIPNLPSALAEGSLKQKASDQALLCLYPNINDKKFQKDLKALKSKYGNCKGISDDFWKSAGSDFDSGCADYRKEKLAAENAPAAESPLKKAISPSSGTGALQGR
jgi:hypothetical protein